MCSAWLFNLGGWFPVWLAWSVSMALSIIDMIFGKEIGHAIGKWLALMLT
ncbi:hypothetical protein [Thalassovita gelatinovora]|nr:hypothetical protein [Thalassovita gelatinovora]QIZ80040.1 hypothetical protein HFZ77_05885 [Thalassovita gelatinovora]